MLKNLLRIGACAMMLASFSLQSNAQQLPNADFEEAWVDCVPYVANGTNTDNGNSKVKGTTPTSWCISNVIGIGGTGATEVGAKVEGYNGSASAVKLTNTSNPMMKQQIVPGYITLGTSWSTSIASFGLGGITIKNSDGGSFGGINFTGRPSSVEFMYKRSRGTAKPDETTTIVAYLWKGHVTQEKVPASIVLGGSPKTVDMVDRDRCVLGMDMADSQGGAVTKSDDFELIGKMVAYITENTEEWTKFHGDFEYLSDATPEMFNIIAAAGDYFGGASAVGEGNSLTVDNFVLLYPKEKGESKDYAGYLTIEMMGNKLAEDLPSTVTITSTGENTCEFLLPELVLEDLGAKITNIKVSDVKTTTDANGTTSYEGEVKNMELMLQSIDGSSSEPITADVKLTGTITADGVVNMVISVLWNGIEINVTFSSSKSNGVDMIEIDEAAAEYYTIQGIRVAEPVKGNLYIVKKGNKATKVIF